MIVTVGATKGGVGKTTVALNLSIGRVLAGRDVWLIDGDRQGTGTNGGLDSCRGRQSACTCMLEVRRRPHLAAQAPNIKTSS